MMSRWADLFVNECHHFKGMAFWKFWHLEFVGKIYQKVFKLGIWNLLSWLEMMYRLNPVNQRRLYNDYPTCSKRPWRLEHVGSRCTNVASGVWNTLGTLCTNVAGSLGSLGSMHPVTAMWLIGDSSAIKTKVNKDEIISVQVGNITLHHNRYICCACNESSIMQLWWSTCDLDGGG